MAEIRQVGHAEFEDAFPLLLRFFVEEGFTTPEADLRENLRVMLGQENAAILAAYVEGRAVGVASVNSSRDLEHGLYAEMEDLYVLPEFRGMGISRQLIEAIKAWCQARGGKMLALVITPEAEAAHGMSRFYQKLGFVDTGRITMEMEF